MAVLTEGPCFPSHSGTRTLQAHVPSRRDDDGALWHLQARYELEVALSLVRDHRWGCAQPQDLFDDTARVDHLLEALKGDRLVVRAHASLRRRAEWDARQGVEQWTVWNWNAVIRQVSHTCTALAPAQRGCSRGHLGAPT
jgi:hypothetical protein